MIVRMLSPITLLVFLCYNQYLIQGFSPYRHPFRQQTTTSFECKWTINLPADGLMQHCQTSVTRRVYDKIQSYGNNLAIENDTQLLTSDENFQRTMKRSINLDKYNMSQQLLLSTGSSLLQLVLKSPLWKYLLVPMARQKIIDTAQANGIPWNECKDWLLTQTGPWNNITESHRILLQQQLDSIPSWYRTTPYHAYETGHLSWKAAVELELASAAIGARNIPKAGTNGETMFRSAFTKAFIEAGALRTLLPSLNDDKELNHAIIDIGCGTGTSTRLLGKQFPQQNNLQITGIDLSPYFIQTGIRLHELLRTGSISKLGDDGNSSTANPWVCTISPYQRIQYLHGDGTNLRSHYDDGTVDIVNVQFVFHEVPISVACKIIQEAYRVLKPNGGQLWISEMDFESPAYKAQRNNPFLFSLVRATEPYLDEYAAGQSIIWQYLYDTFDTITIAAATGRHYALVATNDRTTKKPRWTDMRFDDNGQYRVDDNHLQVWENKSTN